MSKFNGHPEWAIGRGRSKIPYAVPSAGVLDLRAFDGKLVHVNSTATVTTVLAPPNGECMVVFDAACTLAYSTALLLPSAANLTTAAGDCMQVVDEDGTSARVVSYLKANGLSILSGLTPLGSVVPIAAASVDFLNSFTSSYDNYLFLGQGITPAVAAQLQFRFAVAGAADAGANYEYADLFVATAFNVASTVIATAGNVLPAGKGACFSLLVQNANDAVNAKATRFDLTAQNTAGPTYTAGCGYGYYVAANAVSGGRFLWSGANNFQAAGKIRCYGFNN